MPVRGAQRDLLSAFIKHQSEFAIDVPPEERSGRVLIAEDIRAVLQKRKRSTSTSDLSPGSSSTPSPVSRPTTPRTPASKDSTTGFGQFIGFADTTAKHADEDELATPQLALPPWAPHRYNHLIEDQARLHEEIVDWTRFMEPRPAERALRNRLVNRLVDILQRGRDALFPEATVHVFGSMRTGLLVPASDVDICVNGVTSCDVQEALERISSRLEIAGLAAEKPKYIQAKVPIVKFVDRVSHLECDCSVNAIGGRQNSIMVSRMLDSYPQSRPLILIIKTFLRQRKLNEVFTGGLSTYSISLMVIHLLQMFHSGEASRSPRQPVSLGKILIDFFHLYGFLLDYDHVALSVQGGGSYIPKEQFRPARDAYEINRRKGQATFRLAIEDPQNPDNDVSGGSREISHIRTAFKQAFLMLTAVSDTSKLTHDSYTDHPLVLRRPTLLNRILTIDRDLLIRRDALEAAYERCLETEPEAADEAIYNSECEDGEDPESLSTPTSWERSAVRPGHFQRGGPAAAHARPNLPPPKRRRY